jgi:cell division septation protein DedD
MRFLYLTIFILAGSSVVYFNDELLPGFFQGNPSVVKKVSAVKPKSIVNKTQALGPVSHQFTFFETLKDKTMTKYVGLHGEMLPVSLPAKPVRSHSEIIEPAKLEPKKNIKTRENVAEEKKPPMLPRFAVQVSSFRDVKMASALKMKLQKKGFDAYLTEIALPNHGGRWHRVFLGQYVDEALARKAAERARQEHKLNAVVVKKKS